MNQRSTAVSDKRIDEVSVEEARAERDRLARILDSAPDGMVFVDGTTGHMLASQRFCELLGEALVPEKGTQQKLGLVFTPSGRPLAYDELPSTLALRGQETPGQDLLVVRRDGTRIPVSERAVSVFDSQGNIIGAVVAFRDMTAARELERMRDEFLAMVVHDLGNPIHALLMGLRSLQVNVMKGTPVRSEDFEPLLESGRQMGKIARDLLDVARIELSSVPLHKERLDVVDVVRALCKRLTPTLNGRKVVIETQGDLPTAMWDGQRFEQVVTNLLDNAAKHSASDTPIRVRLSEVDGGILLAVEDQGIGIPPEDLPHIFERYYQVRSARPRTGLGLGLAICKGFVEAHGGWVRAQSIVGRGTTFLVWLPIVHPGRRLK